MPASISAITKNVERMAEDSELLALWNAATTDDRTPGQAWSAFIEAADAARIADRIPGTVGRTFRAKYAAKSEPAPKPARKTTARKAPAKKAVK